MLYWKYFLYFTLDHTLFVKLYCYYIGIILKSTWHNNKIEQMFV
jgi:hypothetical protein